MTISAGRAARSRIIGKTIALCLRPRARNERKKRQLWLRGSGRKPGKLNRLCSTALFSDVKFHCHIAKDTAWRILYLFMRQRYCVQLTKVERKQRHGAANSARRILLRACDYLSASGIVYRDAAAFSFEPWRLQNVCSTLVRRLLKV